MKQLFALIIALLACISFAFAAVNVNTATQAELETLNGIGPVKAKAIIDYRSKNGPFKSLEELDKVPGIGQGTLAKIKNDVTLSGQTSVAADAKGAGKKGAAPSKSRETSADAKANSKTAKTSSAEKSKDNPEQKADKKSAAGAAEKTNVAKSPTKESSKTKADTNVKSKSEKKDDTKAEASK
jgi:competence protein ComEA